MRKNPQGTNRSQNPPAKKVTQKQSSAFENTLDLILGDLAQDEVQLLLVEPSGKSDALRYLTVATIANTHLKVPTLNELSDGEYRVLGHVTRHLREGAGDSINILRGSVLGSLAESEVEQIVQTINEPLRASEWRVPDALTSVKPPAVQFFPIAIYT